MTSPVGSMTSPVVTTSVSDHLNPPTSKPKVLVKKLNGVSNNGLVKPERREIADYKDLVKKGIQGLLNEGLEEIKKNSKIFSKQMDDLNHDTEITEIEEAIRNAIATIALLKKFLEEYQPQNQSEIKDITELNKSLEKINIDLIKLYKSSIGQSPFKFFGKNPRRRIINRKILFLEREIKKKFGKNKVDIIVSLFLNDIPKDSQLDVHEISNLAKTKLNPLGRHLDYNIFKIGDLCCECIRKVVMVNESRGHDHDPSSFEKETQVSGNYGTTGTNTSPLLSNDANTDTEGFDTEGFDPKPLFPEGNRSQSVKGSDNPPPYSYSWLSNYNPVALTIRTHQIRPGDENAPKRDFYVPTPKVPKTSKTSKSDQLPTYSGSNDTDVFTTYGKLGGNFQYDPGLPGTSVNPQGRYEEGVEKEDSSAQPVNNGSLVKKFIDYFESFFTSVNNNEGKPPQADEKNAFNNEQSSNSSNGLFTNIKASVKYLS